VVGALALCSLILITIHFRESQGGPLHDAQSAGATVLRPFQVASERVARPFRDLYGYFDGLVGAKSENARLRKEIEALRGQVIANAGAAQENQAFREQLDLRDLPPLRSYARVNARVIGYPSQDQVVIAAGSKDGVRDDAPVVTGHGFIGTVAETSAHTALVTLLTDRSIAVSALDLNTNVIGLVRHGEGDTLILDRVPKEEIVKRGDTVVTAGSQVGELPSLYPKGIPVGIVSYASQNDTDPFKQVQLEPFVDVSGLYAVSVLSSRKAQAKR
jgi:rod shape-determining protein MreC